MFNNQALYSKLMHKPIIFWRDLNFDVPDPGAQNAHISFWPGAKTVL